MHFGMKNDLSTVTDRGQVSIPASVRKAVKIKTGQLLRWEVLSSSELRVSVSHQAKTAGPWAALGYALRHTSKKSLSTDKIMKELREGEKN